MTKTELIQAYAEAAGIPKTQAGEHLERLCDIIAAELLGGGEAPLPRIGKLYVADTAARKGRNPRTGAAIDIPAGKAVKFSVSKSLKESLNSDA